MKYFNDPSVYLPGHPFSSTTLTALVAQLFFLWAGTLTRFLHTLAGNMIFYSLVLLVLSRFALGAVAPTAPGPGEVFTAGSKCSISWTPDESGKWKSFSIGP